MDTDMTTGVVYGHRYDHWCSVWTQLWPLGFLKSSLRRSEKWVWNRQQIRGGAQRVFVKERNDGDSVRRHAGPLCLRMKADEKTEGWRCHSLEKITGITWEDHGVGMFADVGQTRHLQHCVSVCRPGVDTSPSALCECVQTSLSNEMKEGKTLKNTLKRQQKDFLL